MDKRMLFLYSLTHFWVDLSCALLVFRTLAGGVEVTPKSTAFPVSRILP